jgi:hypothetical protein
LNGAAKYYKLAADQNYALAQYNYGRCLEFGRGVVVDLNGAAKYYELAADQNLAAAQSSYGRCHEFGRGIAMNVKRAAEYYQLAADQGEAWSQVTIAFFREHGIGVEQDIAEAVRNYQSASQQQHPDAMPYCGLCQQYGIGFDEDLDEAASFDPAGDSKAILENNLLRCLRALNKARDGDYSRPKRRYSQAGPVDDFASTRPVTVPLHMNNYRTSPVGMRHSQVIATGGFGTVRVRDDSVRMPQIAVKHFANVCDIQAFLREVDIMVKLNHPCVLRILKWALPEGRGQAEIHTEFAAHGSLKGVLLKVNSGEKPAFWNPTGIGILICSLVLGMRYIHLRRIIHHDLKPSNILVNAKEHVWICDFGASLCVDDEIPAENETGTVHYAAPEQYEEGVVCTMKCDVFTFGLVLYEILVGVPVFPPSESQFNVIRRMRDRDLPVRADRPTNYGALMQALLVDCWKQDPADRPSFGDIFATFEAADYQILPDADHVRIREFVERILAWERKAQM